MNTRPTLAFAGPAFFALDPHARRTRHPLNASPHDSSPRTGVALTPRKVTITAAVQDTDTVVYLSQLS